MDEVETRFQLTQNKKLYCFFSSFSFNNVKGILTCLTVGEMLHL